MRFSGIWISLQFFRAASSPSLKVNYNFSATRFCGKNSCFVNKQATDLTNLGQRYFGNNRKVILAQSDYNFIISGCPIR
jgi:hypothetical protein